MYQIDKWFREKSCWKLISVTFLICLIISILCFQYYQHLRETIHEERNGYLDEISKQISINVNHKIDDYYTFLDLISSFMTTQIGGSINSVQSLINKQKDDLHLQDVLLIDSNGLGHRKNGQTIPLSGDMYLRETILNKERSLSTLQTIDNKESVILAVPVENVILDGIEIVALAASFETEVLEQLLSFAPLSEVNEKSDRLLKMSLLICSGIFLISLMLVLLLVLFHRRYRLELENIAYVDPITGGNTLQGFYKKAKETLTLQNRKQYALVYTNIRNFEVLNEQLGHSSCDGILQAFYESINANLADKELVGRVSAAHFCMLLEYENNQNILTRFGDWYEKAKQNVEKRKYSQWMHPEMDFGVYVIENNTVPFPQMITRAKLALREATSFHSTKLRYALYDDKLRRQLLREKQIEDMMEGALKKGEFQVYLQPKYSLPDERMIGAEALTRWISESEGIIYPDEFIPLFEKNGFIIQLDLWVFEEVCRLIRSWLDEEREPIKVSINCSRIHFKKPDFFKEYIKIAKFYNVPENLIEIELTESLALESTQQFIQVIEEIRKAGFGCSVDDFGSGYSSLNMIKDIPVDTLKLDKVFFRNVTQHNKRAESVISNIISMAKSLSMKTVAEGVEEREQVEILKRLGCDNIQGYVFAKPMPIKDFEQFLQMPHN